MYNFLMKVSKKFFTSSWSINKAASKEQQLKFLNSLKIAEESLSHRSYLQYKCQMKFEPTFKVIVLNLISPLLTIGVIIYGLINCYIVMKSIELENPRARAVNLGYSELIPRSLKNEYDIVEGNKKIYITIEDIKFIKNIIAKYPLQWYFLFKCIFKIGLYSYNIKTFNPEAVLTNSEYSFTSSVLTKYCRGKKVKHINYMHGEKIFTIRDSFFEFDKMYIWDEYYIKLFNSLNATNNYIIEVPEKFKCRDSINQKQLGNKLIIKYYLQWESKNELEEINKIRGFLKDKYNFVVRPHPRYSNIKLIEQIFPVESIENSYNVDIMNSIRDSYAICSKYSTVFLQAYLQKKILIIDDITNFKIYHKLKELDYYIFSKEHSLLSNIVYEVKGDTKL